MLADHSSLCKMFIHPPVHPGDLKDENNPQDPGFQKGLGNKEGVCRILQHLRWKFMGDGLLSSVLMVGDEQTFETFQKLLQGPEKL